MEATSQNNDINSFKESFLMNVEVIFYVKKQMRLEKNSIKSNSFITF